MDYRFYEDQSGQYFDKYTIIIDYDPEDYEWGEHDSMCNVFGASDYPFWPQGFGQYSGDYVCDEFLETQKQIFWEDLPHEIKIFALVSGYWGDEIELYYKEAKELLDQGVVQVGGMDHGDWDREQIWFPGVNWGGYDDESEQATVADDEA